MSTIIPKYIRIPALQGGDHIYVPENSNIAKEHMDFMTPSPKYSELEMDIYGRINRDKNNILLKKIAMTAALISLTAMGSCFVIYGIGIGNITNISIVSGAIFVLSVFLGSWYCKRTMEDENKPVQKHLYIDLI